MINLYFNGQIAHAENLANPDGLGESKQEHHEGINPAVPIAYIQGHSAMGIGEIVDTTDFHVGRRGSAGTQHSPSSRHPRERCIKAVTVLLRPDTASVQFKS